MRNLKDEKSFTDQRLGLVKVAPLRQSVNRLQFSRQGVDKGSTWL